MFVSASKILMESGYEKGTDDELDVSGFGFPRDQTLDFMAIGVRSMKSQVRSEPVFVSAHNED